MTDQIIDTGIRFRSHPVLFGPRVIDNKIADKLVLTQLNRFLRKTFPSLHFLVADGETYVRGALLPGEKE